VTAPDPVDLVYLRDGNTALLARWHRPAGAGPFPAVVHVHGGVWNNGSRESDAALCRALATAGIVVVSLDFRQAPQARYPRSITDIHYGLRWVKAGAARLATRPDWVGGLGVSSGGHQLLLAALRPDDPRYARIGLTGAPDVAATVAFAVLCWPVTDPLARYHWAVRTGRQELVALHEAYWGSADAMAEGNPLRVMESRDAAPPPALLVYGSRDHNIPATLTEQFVDAYRTAGGELIAERFEGMPHGFVRVEPGSAAAARAVAVITDFIRRRTIGAGASGGPANGG
jgi:acetyl esterase